MQRGSIAAKEDVLQSGAPFAVPEPAARSSHTIAGLIAEEGHIGERCVAVVDVHAAPASSRVLGEGAARELSIAVAVQVETAAA